MEAKIKLINVTKSFPSYQSAVYKGNYFSIIDIFLKKKNKKKEIIKNLNLDISKGDILGISGKNGSGKSTLIRIISSIYYPEEGQVKIDGSIASIIESETGFIKELTVLDNIYLHCTNLGLCKSKIKKILPKILLFSNLKEFKNTELKFLSSGMYSKLSFSVSIFSDCDILIFDENFSFNDQNFLKKAFKKIKKIKKNKIFIIVSHQKKILEQVCNKILYLQGNCKYKTKKIN